MLARLFCTSRSELWRNGRSTRTNSVSEVLRSHARFQCRVSRFSPACGKFRAKQQMRLQIIDFSLRTVRPAARAQYTVNISNAQHKFWQGCGMNDCLIIGFAKRKVLDQNSQLLSIWQYFACCTQDGDDNECLSLRVTNITLHIAGSVSINTCFAWVEQLPESYNGM